jgi:hypothetical protein
MFLAPNTSTSLQTTLAADAHLAEGEFLHKEQTLNNNNNNNDNNNRVEREIYARRIITLPESVESSCENIVEISSEFSCCKHCVTFTNYQCHLETVESISIGCKSLNSSRMSVVTSIFWDAWIFALSQVKSLSVTNNQLIFIKLLRDYMSCVLLFPRKVLGGSFVFFNLILRRTRTYISCNTATVGWANDITRLFCGLASYA